MKIKIFILLSFMFFSQLLTAEETLKISTIERVPFSYHNENGTLTGFSIEL